MYVNQPVNQRNRDRSLNTRRLAKGDPPLSEQPSARTALHLKRTFDAPRKEVFGAWTDPELFAQWFRVPGASTPAVDMDVRVGGSYRVEWSGELAGNLVGTYLDVEPPERLVYTLRWDPPWHRVMDTGDTQVTVEFRDLGHETEVILIHERLGLDEEVREFNKWGWTSAMDRLAELLEPR